MKYEIQLCKAGESDVPGPEVYWMRNWNTWERLNFIIAVVRGGGKTIVINTGPPADLSSLNEAWVSGYGDPRVAIRRSDDERPENALRRVGVEPDLVDYVLLTPLQAYATANIPSFPNATICISRRGWIEDIHAPLWPTHVPRKFCIPDEVLVYLETEAWSRVRLIEDDEEILPGIQARWVGAHHRSSMAFFIATETGTVAISDCFFKYGNLEQNIPLGVMESLEECMRSYAFIRRSAKMAVPLYDPEVFERHPAGKIP
jgi:glyoxylase-like metal-dependent hydrolase (beta-lactamase superfamily II)